MDDPPSYGDGGGRLISWKLREDSVPCLSGMERRAAHTLETEEAAHLPNILVSEGHQRPNTEC